MSTSSKLAGTISKPSTSSPADTLASPLAKPEGEAEKTIPAIFGPSSREYYASLESDGQNGFFWKTLQATFLWDSGEYSETWPDSGTMRNGRVYARPMSEPRTSASASSSWPTARGEDGESAGNHPGAMDSLTGVVKTWNTPTTDDHKTDGPKVLGRYGTPEMKSSDMRSRNQVDKWRTPDSANQGGPRNRQGSTGNGHQITIAEQAEHWITPHGMSNTDARGKTGGCGGGEFAKQATQWGTPSAHERAQDPKGEQLQNFVEHSPLVQQTRDGPPSSSDTPDLPRRLNPQFVEWLMGFPIGWSKP